MKRLATSSVLLVLILHTAAWAQQPLPATAYPPAPPQQPYPQQPYPQQPYPQQPQQPYPQQPYPAPPAPQPEAPRAPQAPAPAPAYRAPPVYYYYPPPAAHRGIYRPFNMTAGLGAGLLSVPVYPRENPVGYNYLARVGFGLTPDFIIFVGIDGTGVSHPDYDITATNYLLGVQYFVVSRLYLRGGVGITGVNDDSDYAGGSAVGQAFMAGLGIELVQGDSLALALELTSNVGRVRYGAYFSNAVSFSLSFF